MTNVSAKEKNMKGKDEFIRMRIKGKGKGLTNPPLASSHVNTCILSQQTRYTHQLQALPILTFLQVASLCHRKIFRSYLLYRQYNEFHINNLYFLFLSPFVLPHACL